MITGPSGIVAATEFVRKMPGKSQAALIKASDREQYIVKWMYGPRSTTSVRLEALRNSVYQYLGLPVSAWCPIEIPEDLIDEHPQMWINTSTGVIRPNPGLHFASRLLSSRDGVFYEYLPERLFSNVANRSDFWGAYAADVWTERFDIRQAVFVPDQAPGSLRAVFIDHGSAFALMTSKEAARLTSCLYSNRRIYPETETVNNLHDWIEGIRRHGYAAVARAIESLPSSWISSTVAEKADKFVERIQDLREIIFPSISRFSSKASKTSRKHCTVHVVLRAGQIL